MVCIHIPREKKMVPAISWYAMVAFIGLLVGSFIIGPILSMLLESASGIWLGSLIGAVGGVLILRKIRAKKYKNCQFCQTLISRMAIKCPSCGSDLS